MIYKIIDNLYKHTIHILNNNSVLFFELTYKTLLICSILILILKHSLNYFLIGMGVTYFFYQMHIYKNFYCLNLIDIKTIEKYHNLIKMDVLLSYMSLIFSFIMMFSTK